MLQDFKKAPDRENTLALGSREYHIMEVKERWLENSFLEVPEVIYRNDPNWIPVIKEEIVKIFDPSVNPYFKQGAAARWVLFNQAGTVAGRIAAFIHPEKMMDGDTKVGSIGFFECVNDQQAAFLLFDTAASWLEELYEVEAIEGPVNFGENDKYWGLLVKGFTPPSYGMNYNPPWYQAFFEAYGFQIQYRQLTNYVSLEKPMPERFVKIAQRISGNVRYTFKPFRYKDRERFIDDFVQIYNLAWASFNNHHPMDKEVVRESLKEMRPVMEEDFIWFAYADGKPAGVFMAMPDVNEVIRYSGASFNWWGKLKFLFYKYTKGFSCVRVIVMGIVPEMQRHGLESALILHAEKEVRKRPRYKHVQLAWVGDFNEKMMAIHKAMGAVEDKQHATFRKTL